MNLTDFQSKWDRLVDKLCQKGLKQLTMSEKVWLTLQTLLASVRNGGIISLYCNPWPYMNYIQGVLNSLDILNDKYAMQVKKIIKKSTTCFKQGRISNDIEQRNKAVTYFSKKENQLLNECNVAFFNIDDNLEKELIKYLAKHSFKED